MTRNATIKLLLINPSDNQTEELVRLFRNAGRIVRPQRLSGAEELAAQLSESWDLLIVDTLIEELELKPLVSLSRELAPKLPIIALCEAEQREDILNCGVEDAIPHGDANRLIHSAVREVRAGELEKQIAHLQTSLEDAEKRCEQLMEEAPEAIAYVSDGMIVDANELFANRFGFDSVDDLDFLPMVDLISPEQHEQFKQILKHPEDSGQVELTGVNQQGEQFALPLGFEPATFDGEACIQVTVHEEGSTNPTPTAATTEPAPTQAPAVSLGETLDAQTYPETGSALVVSIDRIGNLLDEHGLQTTQHISEQIFSEVEATLNVSEWITLSLDMRAALLTDSTDHCLESSKKLCKKIEETIIESAGQTMQCSISIGIAPLTTPPTEAIELGYKAIKELRQEVNREGLGGTAKVFEEIQDFHGLRFDGDIEAALETALNDERFHLLYQPVISLRGAAGEHYEVLLRMLDEQDEEILPDNFLDALSAEGVHTKLDRWIIVEACAALARVRAEGNDTRLIINLTAHCLQDETLLPWMTSAIEAIDIPPDSLIFQFREMDVNNYLNGAKEFATTMGALGCLISISRFGRALDPLKTLNHIPANFVKVDGGFTRDLQNDQGDEQVLGALVHAINNKQMKAIVPHVESATVLAKLWQIGTDYIQGYYLQAPQREMTYEFTDIA